MADDTLVWTLARAIRAERSRRGISQEAMGHRLGLSRVTISEIETGRRRIWADELPAICRVLGVTLADLMRDASPEDRSALGL